MFKKGFLFLLIFPVFAAFSYAQSAIETYGEGEASIITDKASAEMEALARAKWNAIENATGVFIKSETIVENFVLVDDIIKKEAQGVIKDIRIIKKLYKNGTVKINIRAKVIPKEAEKALSLLTKNTALAVFIVSSQGEMNPVSIKLIENLTNQNFTVIDIASAKLDPSRVEWAMRQKRFFELRHIMNKALAGAMVIGKVTPIIKTRRGQAIGYDVVSPFYIVDEKVEYYIITKDKLENTRILSAGSVSEKGTGINLEDACEKGMEEAGEKLSEAVLRKLGDYLKTEEKNVSLQIEGLPSITYNFEIKQKLQNLAWVASVEDRGLGRFLIKYQENTIYLANSIMQMANIYVKDFSPFNITAEYRK